MSCCTPTNSSGASGLSGAWPGCAPAIWPRSPTFPPPARGRAPGPRNLRAGGLGNIPGAGPASGSVPFYDIKHMDRPTGGSRARAAGGFWTTCACCSAWAKRFCPNAAAPRTERRSRRAGGGFRHAAGGSGTRGRHRGRGTAALTAMGRASTASSDRLHLRKTLSGGASGGTQGLSRGPGHGGIDLAACPERVSLCWNTLKFLQGRKNVGSLQKRFPSLPQYCLKP